MSRDDFSIFRRLLGKGWLKRGLLVSSAMLLGACANMNPLPVDPDKHLDLQGIRYYETRPFIAVHRPFPIDSRTYLVDGLLSADGSSVEITVDASWKDELKHFHHRNKLVLDSKVLFSAGSFVAAAQPKDPAPIGIAQGGSGETKPPEGQKPEGGATAKGDAEAGSGSTTGEQVANSNVTVQTDNAGYSFLPVNDLFSILYLPDYDREFVIDASAKMGLARLNLTRGPGGVLLAMSAEVDNSAVVGPLLQAYGKLVDAATTVAGTAITGGLPVVPAAQGSDGKPAVSDVAAARTHVTLRMHKVKFAAPGVYPFLKPAELDRLAVWRNAAPITRKYLQPVLPYQVPYDYFEILVFEQVLLPQGVSRLVDRYADNANRLVAGTVGVPDTVVTEESDSCSDKKQMTSPGRDRLKEKLSNELKGSSLFRKNAELTEEPETDKDPDGKCLTRIVAKYRLTNAEQDTEALKASAQEAFKRKYSGTELVLVKDPGS